MKHQFKFNPLATAILTLLCGTSVSVYAESTDDVVSTVDNNQLKQSLKEAYPGQNFFEQYYVSKDSPEAKQHLQSLKGDKKASGAQYCSNVWVTPIDPSTPAVPSQEATSVITADNGYYNPNGDSTLSGNVVIDQQGRMIRADKVTIDQTQTYANAEGNVQLAQGGILAQSQQINYNLHNSTGDLNNSFYIAEQEHAHGHADKIIRKSPTVIELQNATYTTCPPDEKPTWNIQAKKMELNQETGRGVTKDTRIYVKGVPVIAVPYFNFPIDDRRTTGILNPNFGYTNDGGLQLTVPVYLNLAPNYDATLTPRIIGTRGAMLEGEFRYLTKNFGEGELSGSYLPSDKKLNDQDRKDFHFEHYWKINDQWATNAEYNYVSDKDFTTDFNTNPNTKTQLNQRRAWELNYAHGIPGLKATLKVEDFQTLDPTVKDVDKPYARLPQLLVNYIGGNPQGFQYEYNNDTAYFKKSIDDVNDYSTQPSGTRLYNQFAARYNFRNTYSFVIPEISVRSLNTFYDQNTVDALNNSQDSKNKSVVVPQFTLDAGLTFEREGKYLQTLSPRVFYAYAPYKNQDGYPNFDSTSASISYDQLFNPYRFYGHDRLDDNNFMSLGLSYSLFDTIGLERLRASVGQSYYFEDRRVTLSNNPDLIDKQSKTGPVVSLSSQLNQNFTVKADSAWMPNGDNAQRDFQVYYANEKGNLYNLGYFNRKLITDRQKSYDQVVASFIQPVHNNWSIMGHAQYDLENNVFREYLLGLNYESCCWGVSVYGRSYYNDLDDMNSPTTKPKRAIMAEITLKGLGGLNNKLASLLQSRILGFDKTNQTWTQR